MADNRFKQLARELLWSLEDSAEFHCHGCGNGREGCAVVHYVNCPVVKLLTRAKVELGLED